MTGCRGNCWPFCTPSVLLHDGSRRQTRRRRVHSAHRGALGGNGPSTALPRWICRAAERRRAARAAGTSGVFAGHAAVPRTLPPGSARVVGQFFVTTVGSGDPHARRTPVGGWGRDFPAPAHVKCTQSRRGVHAEFHLGGRPRFYAERPVSGAVSGVMDEPADALVRPPG
jgi:hypothetical protein